MLKVVELFSGIGAYSKALENLKIKHEVVAAVEFDKKTMDCYNLIHGSSFEATDITKLTGEELPDCDMICYSPPCFQEGTLVTTKNGLKNIEDIEVGDLVLTHKNRFRPVVTTIKTMKQGIYKVKVQGSPITYATGEHPYYTRVMSRVWDNVNRVYKRIWGEPKWTKVSKLSNGDFMHFAKNTESENPYKLTKDECWLVGRYIADGYLRRYKMQKGYQCNAFEVIYCIGKDKAEEYQRHISGYTEYGKYERTVYRSRLHSQRLFKLCEQCGSGAINKEIQGYLLSLPAELLKEVIDGYMSGDGCYTNQGYSATSISKKLVYSLGQAMNKCYGTSYNITFCKRPKTTVIEGRTVNQHDTWMIRFQKEPHKQNHSVIIEDSLYQPFKSSEYNSDFRGYVYNIEVEEDNSYVANNCTVHNCQSFSVAGKNGGTSDPRGTLFWDALRIIQAKKPKYCLMENVKNLTGKKHRETFDEMLLALESVGYTNYWQVLNSKNYGVPQNRERVFVVSIRNDLVDTQPTFEFPLPFDNGLRLKDLLEDEVDEKFYISDEKCQKLLGQLKDKEISNTVRSSGRGSLDRHCWDAVVVPVITPDRLNKRQNGRRFKENGDPSFTVTAVDRHGVLVSDNEISVVGSLEIKGNEQIRRVYSPDGLSPTLNTCEGGNRQPKVIVREKLDEQRDTREVLSSMWEETRTQGNQWKDGVSVVVSKEDILRQGMYEGELQGSQDRINETSENIATLGEPRFSQGSLRDMSNNNQEAGSTSQGRESIKQRSTEFNDSMQVMSPQTTQAEGQMYDLWRADEGSRVMQQTSDTSEEIRRPNVCQAGTQERWRIRKLTALECFRLQSFSDSDYYVLHDNGISNSQIYKCAGNSIPVCVLEAIFKELLCLSIAQKL